MTFAGNIGDGNLGVFRVRLFFGQVSCSYTVLSIFRNVAELRMWQNWWKFKVRNEVLNANHGRAESSTKVKMQSLKSR